MIDTDEDKRMKAITCKYLPPTNTKPSRIKAYDMDNNQVTINYQSADSSSGDTYRVYERAARALCDKMGWNIEIVGGGIKDGYVFVLK